MCILPLTAVCSQCVKACLEQTDGSWVAVFSLCSYGLTVCSIRLLIVLKCCAASSRHAAEKSSASMLSAWKLSIPSSSVTRHAVVPPLKHHLQTSETPQQKTILNLGSFAGPCKDESRNKMHAVAHEARKFGVRPSIWIISHWFPHQQQVRGTRM